MKRKPYPKYKSSGVEWLPQAPEGWQISKNKVVFREIDERSASDDGLLLTVSHITGVTPRSEKTVNMFLAETLEGYKICRDRDLVVNTMWAWMRSPELPPIIQMCDALSRNVPKIVETLVANCNAHGRRNFVKVTANFPEPCWRRFERSTVMMR